LRLFEFNPLGPDVLLGPGGALTFVLFSVTCDIFMAKVLYYTVFSTNSATIICQQRVYVKCFEIMTFMRGL